MKALDPREAEIREALVAIAVNTVVWILRLFFGIIVNSLALIAEAWHSFSDNITSIMVYLGGKLGSKPPDKNHPYGHGKIADLATMFMGLALIIIGISISYESIQRFLSGYSIALQFLGPALIVIIITGVIKEVLARYALRLYRVSGSSLCYADAWHHRVDALMSIVVLISFIGIAFLNTYLLDISSAIVIAILLGYEGGKVFAGSTSILIDTVPMGIETQIIKIAKSITGINEIHDVKARSYGGNMYVEIKVHVDPKLSIEEAHEIAHKIEEKVKSGIPNVKEVLIHIEPSSQHED